MMQITKYSVQHEEDLILLLKKEPDWESLTNKARLNSLKEALLNSITLVCYFDGSLCGYIRAIDDPFGIYVSELYVAPQQRNNGCGREMLSRLKEMYSTRDIYILSDEDLYYEKLGIKKIGSVFQL